MRVKIDGTNRWLTREREEIPVITMADSHLLAAVHMMERNRLEKITEAKRRFNYEKENGVISILVDETSGEIFGEGDEDECMRVIQAVYSKMSSRYYELVAEGIHRGIVFRGPSEVERVVKVEEKEVIKYKTRIVYRPRKSHGKKAKRSKSRS